MCEAHFLNGTGKGLRMRRNTKKIFSFFMAFFMMMSCLEQYAYAADDTVAVTEDEKILAEAVDEEEIPEEIEKEDFKISSEVDQSNGVLEISVWEQEELKEKHVIIKDVYAIIRNASNDSILSTYVFGYKGNGKYDLQVAADELEVTSLHIEPVIRYVSVSDGEKEEREISDCYRTDENVAVDDGESETFSLDGINVTLASEKETEAEREEAEDEKGKEEDSEEEKAGKVENSEEGEAGKVESSEEEKAEKEENSEEEKVREEEIAEETEEIGIASIAEEMRSVKNQVTVTNPDGKQMKYHFTVTADGYTSVRLAVWSETSKQGDLKWYSTEKKGNTYTVDVDVKNHASTGVYIAHVYGIDTGGTLKYITGTRFTVDAPKRGTAAAVKTESGFQATIHGVTSPSGIDRVEAAVWCGSDQKDLVWYTTKEKDGKYTLDFDAVAHGILKGTYYVHFYAVDGNGFKSYCGGLTQKVEIQQNKLIIQNKDQQQKKYQLTLYTAGYTNIKYAVWSEKDGQDDLKWYSAKKAGSIYTAEVSVGNHKATGRYYVHAYGEKNGKLSYINGSVFTVDAPSEGKFAVTAADDGFQVIFDEISSPSGISKVEAAVWCSDNQSDLIWHTLTPDKGTYTLDVKMKDHKMLLGTYIVHVYAVDGNGIKSYCGGVRQNVSITAQSMKASVSKDTCEIIVSGLKYNTGTGMSIAVWSQANGQDDLTWYDAKKSGNDYTVSIAKEKLEDLGTYYAHAYATDAAGKRHYVKGITFSVDYKIALGDIKNGQLYVNISVKDKNISYSGFQAQVWTKTNKSDLQTVQAVKGTDNTYSIAIPLWKFALYSGKYYINVYGVQSSNTRELLYEKTKEIEVKKGTVAKPVISSNKMTYTVTLNDVDLKGMEKSVRFAVWSDVNGQDDLVWYTAVGSGGSYKADIPIYNHKGTGKYYLHIYATLQDGSNVYLTGMTFQVDQIVQAALEVQNLNNSKGTAQLVEQIGNLGYKISAVSVGIWNADTKGKVVWYDMGISANTYVATFNIKNHGYEPGKYTAHVYATDASGVKKFVNGISFTIAPSNIVLYEKEDRANGTVTIWNPNVNGTAVSSIKMATWSNSGNQDDLKWIDAKKNSTGGYYVNIKRTDYKRSGDYTTHIYGYINGKSYYLAGISYSVYKTGEFDEYAQEVMHNIIFAVETGGQVYGKAQYDCFAPAYNISQKETAITIGAGGWFATEAQRLLKLIREENPAMFALLDTQEISKDIDTADWTTYGSDGNGTATIVRGSAKAKCIQALISSSAGIRVQNRLVDEQMVKYVKEAKALGVTDLKGQMFLANVRHLGGYSPMKWVVDCCKEDNLSLTMRNLYNSMRNHTENKAGNGVGADKYNSRHVKVMGWLDSYIE